MITGSYQYETYDWHSLSAADRAAWLGFRRARPSLSSPCFTLDWCDAVHAARGDLKVARIGHGGVFQGLLPFHHGHLGALRPAGGPMSDVHGFVCGPSAQIDPDSLVAALGARTFRFTGAPADDPGLAFAATPADGFALDLSDGYDAYVARRSAAEPKAFRNLRSRRRRLDGRAVEIVADDRDPAALAALLALKSDQYRRTRQIDVFRPGWTRRLVDDVFSRPAGGALRGRLSTLRVDGRVAAGHFGLQADGVLHYWFTAYDPEFAAASPGVILLQSIAESVAGEGVARIDLGGGAYRFKQEFADLRTPLGAGVIRGRTLLAGAAHGAGLLARGIETLPIGRLASAPRRALRRLDRLIAFHEAPQDAPRSAPRSAPSYFA